MKAQVLYDWREKTEDVTGNDLHAMFRYVCGEPSPKGNTEIDLERLFEYVENNWTMLYIDIHRLAMKDVENEMAVHKKPREYAYDIAGLMFLSFGALIAAIDPMAKLQVHQIVGIAVTVFGVFLLFVWALKGRNR